jgi:hypothetical protein
MDTALELQEIARLKGELEAARAEAQQLRQDAAKVVLALDAALQWGETLFAFLPEGMPLSDGVKGAKHQLDLALTAVGIRK